jgi:MraZ protein
MFLGTHPVTVDEKGRLAIPARFRAALMGEAEGRLVMAPAPDGETRLYPQPEFERIARELVPTLATPELKKAMLRGFIGRAIHLEMDAQGRILVPAQFRTGLTASAVLVGQMDYLALWGETDWNARAEASREHIDAAFAALNF